MWVRVVKEVELRGVTYKIGAHNVPSDVARDLIKADAAHALRMDVPPGGPPRNGVEKR